MRLRTSDGQDIGAWLVNPGAPGPVSPLGGDPVVLMLHGNGGSRTAQWRHAEPYLRSHHPVMLISLRAHGDSSGERNDFGLSARLDVVAAVDFLESRHRPVVIQGVSLGAAAAIFAGPQLGKRVQGYILECPYQDLRTAVRHRTQIYLPPLLDQLAYAGLLLVSPLVAPQIDQIAPLEHIGAIPAQVPILLMAGARDSRATPEEARALAQRAGEHCQLVLFPEGRHEALCNSDPKLYEKTVEGFLQAIPKSADAGKPADPRAGAASEP